MALFTMHDMVEEMAEFAGSRSARQRAGDKIRAMKLRGRRRAASRRAKRALGDAKALAGAGLSSARSAAGRGARAAGQGARAAGRGALGAARTIVRNPLKSLAAAGIAGAGAYGVYRNRKAIANSEVGQTAQKVGRTLSSGYRMDRAAGKGRIESAVGATKLAASIYRPRR